MNNRETYNKIKDLHQNYFPEMRVGQFLNNFTQWHEKKYGNDFFYLENNVFCERLTDFVLTLKGMW